MNKLKNVNKGRRIDWEFVLRELHFRRKAWELTNLAESKGFMFTACRNCGWDGNLAHTHLHEWHGEIGERKATFFDVYLKGYFTDVYCPHCESNLPLAHFKVRRNI